MIWEDDTSVWNQTGSYGRTRLSLISMNTKNNIVIPGPIPNDTAAAMLAIITPSSGQVS
jgi:hypothetical protein